MSDPEDAERLDPDEPVWVDAKTSRVYVDGRVVLRDGVLEMFACPAGTKEHESVVAVDAPAFLVHTALLAVGAEPGSPARFEPEYQAPSGTVIDVQVQWKEGEQTRSARAQDWVRNADTGEAMKLPFVFAGSGFWTDPDTKRNYYLAESGDMICVSNFGAAMLDVPAPSTQANDELWFEPFTERIPAIDTPIRLVLQPKTEDAAVKPAAFQQPGPAPLSMEEAIAVLRSATPGEGSTPERQAAWRVASSARSTDLVLLLRGMKDASRLAENWLRTAFDAAAEATPPDSLPKEQLTAFLQDVSQSPRARRTAYELLSSVDADAAEALLNGFLDDPSLEIRFDAVDHLIGEADVAEGDARVALLRQGLAAARSLDQIESIAAKLEEAGEELSLADELGFVRSWRVTGPFDNRDEAGFDVAYPPETELDPDATYQGHDAEGEQGPFGWSGYTTEDRLGELDLNAAIGGHKGAVGYAWATVVADQACEIEVRLESRVAAKVWVNGTEVVAYEIYHTGTVFDQYRAAARLKAGENQILVKACQNEQTDPWAQVWWLKLRLTDSTGGALPDVTVLPVEENPE